MKLKSSRTKTNMEAKLFIVKKQRSRRPRQVRSQISPIAISSLNSSLPRKCQGFTACPVDLSSCSYFGDDVSCDSSRVTVESSLKKRKSRETEGIERNEGAEFRRITRSYYKKKEIERKGREVEVSESSCVESNSGADCVASGEKSFKLRNRLENVKGIQASKTSNSVAKSESSLMVQNRLSNAASSKTISLEIKESNAVSFACTDESCMCLKTSGESTNRALELSEISKNDAVSVEESVGERKPPEADLACAEHFSYDDVVSDYSSSQETAFSGMQTEIFPASSSDVDFSDYTSSIFLDSGSEFSEKSVGDSPPSPTYSLLLEFRKQFSRSSASVEARRSSILQAELLENSRFLRFEDEDDEECYQRFRERERRQLLLHDYTESYKSTTEYGDLILHQRSKMVHWIVEQSTIKEFQQETMFLGVSLLDRFLSKGFFKNKRNLQIVGIACLTLATRIEENQPYNSVRQKNFCIGRSMYSRYEVVAMEWLVQEVLDFRCFLPTIYNFMWFYLKAARADAVMEKRAKYLAVLALSDHDQLRNWPSTIAAGLVMLASLENKQIASYQRVIEIHVRTKENDLHECIKSLEWLIEYVS